MGPVNAIAMSIGYGLMLVGGLALAVGIFAGLVIVMAHLSNRAQRAFVESIGGWATFLEFRLWVNGRSDDR